MNAVEDKGVLK